MVSLDARRAPATPALCLVALMCAALLSLPARDAAAHVREPEVIEVAFGPDDPSLVIAVTSFGLLRSRDAGTSWDWICAAAYQANELDNPALALAPDAVVLLGLFEGLLRGADAGCTWTQPASQLADTIIADIVAEPNDPASLLALQRTNVGTPDGLWRTRDGGQSWTSLEAPLPAEMLLRDVRIAPSQPTRLFAAATRPANADDPVAAVYLLRSDDAGASWSALELALEPGEIGAELFGVDPLRADRVYLGTRVADGDIEHPERVLVYDHTTQLVRSALSLPRVDALVSDGTTLWVGGQRGAGLWRSDNDAESFDQVAGGAAFDVRCLALHPGDGALWLCGKPLREAWGLARSSDGGDTLEPVFVRADIERRDACASDSATSAVCDNAQWTDLVADLDLDPALLMTPDGEDTASTDVGDGDTLDTAGDASSDTRSDVDGADAVLPPPALDGSADADADTGCCRAVAGAPQRHGRAAWGLATLLLLALWRRRRTRT